MSSVIIAGDTSGTVTLAAPAVAGTTTITLPSTSGTMATTASLGGGATTTTGSSNITLTASSNRVQAVTMTAADKSVILPDATTISSLGGPLYIITNYGSYIFTIKNSSGVNIAEVSSNQTLMLSLSDNSTAAGIWLSEDANYDLSFSDWTTISSSQTSNGSYLMATDCSGYISASKISSTSAIVTWQQGTSGRDIYGSVVSYSGTTITVGTPTLIYNGSTTASFLNKVLMLDSTNGLLFVTRNSNNVIVPFTLSGTTITVGTTSSTFGSSIISNNSSILHAIAMSSTVAVVSYRTNATAPYTAVINTVTHNGSSAPTLGTASSSVQLYSSNDNAAFGLSKIDSTTLFMAYTTVTTAYIVARVATLSGTSAPTLGTANTTAVIGVSNNMVGMNIFPVSSTEVIVFGGANCINYTVSGTTVTYVGYQAYSTYTTNALLYKYLMQSCFLGDNILASQWAAPELFTLKRIGSYIYVKSGQKIGKKMNIDHDYDAAYTVALDSTTAFAFTNNANSGYVIGSIIKYIGT
jgi:hypothetical protein